MKKYLYTTLLLFVFAISNANNITLTNLGTTYTSATGVVTINFDLAWDNSWRSNASNNWDAAWVFFKYKDGGQWIHLDVTGYDITLPSGYTATVPPDKRGVFIHRDNSNVGIGNAILPGCQIGVLPQMGTFDIKAFALEMVSVPTGPFYAGDGVTSGRYSRGGDSEPFVVAGNGIGKGNNYAWELNTPNNTTTLSNNFPTGYYSYYMMKYELSNAGYRDFLNCLTYTQQTARMISPANSPVGTGIWFGLNYVEIATPGNAATITPAVFGCDANNNNIYNEPADGEWVSIGAINIEDMYTYLDWAALRPMTDLEFEKACRGPLLPIPGQYAWGTTLLTKTGTIGLTNPLANNEVIAATGTLNTNLDSANFSTINRALRNGIFATATSSRSLSGAGYYGAMELTGNLCELTINCYNSQAVTFDGSHGDGNLGLTQYNTNWPLGIGSHTTGGGSGSIVTVAFALNARGGSFYSDASATLSGGYGKISYLIPYINSNSTYAPQAGACSAYRTEYYGIRGVRSQY